MCHARCEEVVRVSFDKDALTTWLKTVRGWSVYLVLDMIEEEVYVESLPALFDWERPLYMARQLKKRFPKTSFCHAQPIIGKGLPWQERGGLLRLQGFNDDHGLKQLITWLESSAVMLDGIYSLPFLLPSLMQNFNVFAHEKAVVYLVRIDADHFRQLLLIDGQVQTSRFIQVNDMSRKEQLVQMRHELSLLIKFVHGQKMLDYQIMPQMLYVTDDEADRLLAWQVFEHTPFCQRKDMDAFMALSDIQATDDHMPYETRLPALIMQQSALPKTHYMPALVQYVLQTRQIKQAIFWVVFLLLLGFIGYIGYFFVQTDYYEQGTTQLQHKKVEIRQQTHQIRQQFQLETSAHNLKTAVEWTRVIAQVQHNQALMQYLQDLSLVLTHFPSIQLTDIEWIAVDQAQRSVLTQDYTVHVAAVILADSMTRLKTILQTLDDFVLTMQQQPSITAVKVSKKPVDIDSDNSFSVKVDDEQRDLINNPYVYPFAFTLIFKGSDHASLSQTTIH
jgi:hypothetical protein